MTARRKSATSRSVSTARTIVTRRVPPFIQILATPYTNTSGDTTSGISALDASGVVWQYRHGEKAWVQVSTDRVFPVD